MMTDSSEDVWPDDDDAFDDALAIDCGALDAVAALIFQNYEGPEMHAALRAIRGDAAADPLDDRDRDAIALWRTLHGPIQTEILVGSVADGDLHIVSFFPPFHPARGPMMKTLTIVLGEREFTVPLLRFSQVRDIECLLIRRAQENDPDAVPYDLAIEVIAIGLRDENPGITAAVVREMKGTGNQLVVAMRRVMAFANTGEAEVPEAPAPETATAAVA